jgi:PAS domain S-box-containing protein
LLKTEVLLENYKSALDLHSIVAITDRTGKITFANNEFCKISQYTSEELLGQDHRMLNSGYHDKAFFAHMWKTISAGQPWHGDMRNRAKDGSDYWVKTTIVPFKDGNGDILQYIAIRTDITEKVEMAEKLSQLNRRLQYLSEELNIEKESLNNKNIALKEIISHIEDEKNRVKATMLSNLETVIYPLLESMRQHAKSLDKKFIDIAVSSLKDISEPFLKETRKMTCNLTPKELQICNMIRNGLAVKEIADMLHLSSRTVGKHRENIRNKLEIKSKKINLATYLLNASASTELNA